MAFVPSFTVSQVLGEPSELVITDTSTGTDAAIVDRRIYLQKSDGSYLVPTGTTTDYVDWPTGTTTKTIDCLDKDYALQITVQWLNVSDAVLYTDSSLEGLTQYNEYFDYGLTQQLTGNPLLINDNKFFEHKSNLRTYIDSGNQAIVEASDIYGAQICYDRATEERLNSQYLFNINS